MTKNDPCPRAIFNLANQNNICQYLQPTQGNAFSEKDLVSRLFSVDGSHNNPFVTTKLKERLSAGLLRRMAFFGYCPGTPDVCYDSNGQKVLIECKRIVKSSGRGGNRTNACEARNGLLQLVEYCTWYSVNEGILLVFDRTGRAVDWATQALVSQFRNFLNVEIHLIWLSANPNYHSFV